MSSRDFQFHDGESGAALAVRLVRRRGASKITKLKKDGTVVLSCGPDIQDMETDVINFFAELLGIKSGNVTVIAGQNRSEKLLSFIDIDPETVQKIVVQKLSEN